MRLKLVVVLDGLYADNPTIRLIRSYGWHFIIIAKDDNHASLIKAVDALDRQGDVKRLVQRSVYIHTALTPVMAELYKST